MLAPGQLVATGRGVDPGAFDPGQLGDDGVESRALGEMGPAVTKLIGFGVTACSARS